MTITRVFRWLLLALFAIVASPAFAQDWHAEWQKTVDAANSEGSLILYSQPNQDARDFILREFPKVYPAIKVSLSVIGSPEFIARIRTERNAGKYLWDVALAGPPGGFALAHDGFLDPVLPEFIDPEIKNPDLWGGWHDAFLDADSQYVFAMAKFIVGPWFDALKVPPDKIASLGLKALLDPALRVSSSGTIHLVSGSGTTYAYVLRPRLGDDGLKKLIIDQKVVFMAQQDQVVEAMARGVGWIGIGPFVRALWALSGGRREGRYPRLR